MVLFLDALLDALIDGVKMLPFLYLAYLLIEWLERHHGESIEGALAGGGRWGFIPGALLGCVPQCGFCAVASNLYASRVITPGTLLAVFIATSDEAIPLLAAEPSQWVTLVLLLACKELFHLDNAELVFTEDALHAIAKKTVERKSGARGLRSVVEELLIPIMYDIPSDATITKVTIDADTVAGGEPHIEHGMMRPRYKNMASQQ